MLETVVLVNPSEDAVVSEVMSTCPKVEDAGGCVDTSMSGAGPILKTVTRDSHMYLYTVDKMFILVCDFRNQFQYL